MGNTVKAHAHSQNNLKLNPLFSIIVPFYNRRGTIQSAINSVLEQTMIDFEIIIVDDGSPFAISDELNFEDQRIRLVQIEENKGPSGARNYGANYANGKFLIFLDSDDLVKPGWLESFSRKLNKKDQEVVCCGCKNFWGNGKEHEVMPEDLGSLFSNTKGLFLSGTFCIKKTDFEKIGGYDAQIFYGENTELSYRIIQGGLSLDSIDDSLVLIRKYESKIRRGLYSREKVLNSVERILKKHQKWLYKDKKKLMNYYSIAGVCSVVLRDYRKARYYFAFCVKLNPFQTINYLRLISTYFPLFYKFRLRNAGYR